MLTESALTLTLFPRRVDKNSRAGEGFAPLYEEQIVASNSYWIEGLRNQEDF